MSNEGDETTQSAPATTGNRSEVTVLVVDDEPSNRTSLEKIFEREGMRVLSADGAKAALELARKHRVEVVLTDLMMPDGSGLDLLAEAGIEFTLLDDYHFKQAGLDEHQLHGYYLTEDEGRLVKVFLISEPMRYLVPWKDPEDAIAYLGQLSQRVPDAVVVCADDGEKFGGKRHIQHRDAEEVGDEKQDAVHGVARRDHEHAKSQRQGGKRVEDDSLEHQTNIGCCTRLTPALSRARSPPD